MFFCWSCSSSFPFCFLLTNDLVGCRRWHSTFSLILLCKRTNWTFCWFIFKEFKFNLLFSRVFRCKFLKPYSPNTSIAEVSCCQLGKDTCKSVHHLLASLNYEHSWPISIIPKKFSQVCFHAPKKKAQSYFLLAIILACWTKIRATLKVVNVKLGWRTGRRTIDLALALSRANPCTTSSLGLVEASLPVWLDMSWRKIVLGFANYHFIPDSFFVVGVTSSFFGMICVWFFCLV